MTHPVFLTPEVTVDGVRTALLEGATPAAYLTVEGEEARHARTVQRLRVGEELDLIDGRGARVRAVVVSGRDDPFTVEVNEVTREGAPTPRLCLVQALAKGGRDEQALETATELGVDQIIPWQADRSIVRWDRRKAQTGVERWQRLAVAAAKQSRRAWVPHVTPVETSAGLARTLETIVSDGGVVLVCHESSSSHFAQISAAEKNRWEVAPLIAVVVGPEGGITDDELAMFVDRGAVPVLLGRHVMRSSTAGPAALAALNVTLGRW